MDNLITIISFGPDGWGDNFLIGAFLTLQLAFASLVIALPLGFALAMMKLSHFAPLKAIAGAYTLIIRGVPEFLILLLVFFGSESLINNVLISLGLSEISIPKFNAAVFGLSLIFGAYACEIFRGAWLAVPKGQIEAASAIGMSHIQIIWRIRLPQLLRFAIPGLGNLWMVLIKDTSLAAVLALNELLWVAKVAGEVMQQPLITFGVAGILYLIMTGVSDQGRKKLEAMSKRGH